MELQTAKQNVASIAAGSTPVYSLAGAAGSEAKITANNAAAVNMTWLEFELGLLMMEDWMESNTYGWGSASVWNGADKVGMIYVSS